MRYKWKARGFTVIELVAVVAIIGIIAAMIVPKVAGHTQTANNTKYLVDAKTIVQAVEIYNSEKAAYEIDDGTKLSDIKSKLMPSTGKQFLNSWPKEIKIKDGNSYTIVKDNAMGNYTLDNLTSFIQNPED